MSLRWTAESTVLVQLLVKTLLINILE